MAESRLAGQTKRQWEQGQVCYEGYRDTARLRRNGIKKAKAQLEMNLARDAKNNKKTIRGIPDRKGR